MELPIESKIETLTLASGETRTVRIRRDAKCCYSITVIDPEEEAKYHKERLKSALDQFKKEREDTNFSRNCLFCRKHFTGNRSVLLDHLLEQHNFTIGNPDNIVYVNELLDRLEQLLRELRCFFCEKIFKDWGTLKEHMRKKQHKRINPINRKYDQFYLINYLDEDKTWQDILKEDDGCSQDDEKDLMDWNEEDDEESVYICLFCTHKTPDLDQAFSHLKESHGFDLKDLVELHKLNFYQQIKLINFIRKKVLQNQCINCDEEFDSNEKLHQHFAEKGHSSLIPDTSVWDQAMYYFPTLENDRLLCALYSEDSDVPE